MYIYITYIIWGKGEMLGVNPGGWNRGSGGISQKSARYRHFPRPPGLQTSQGVSPSMGEPKRHYSEAI